ncbi:MAG: replication protein [Microviridae sp.]|nr:MAG: replication protein [Microviridae sp.]
MNTKIDFYYKNTKVDSLRIKLNLTQCTYIDPDLLAEKYLMSEHGTYLKTMKDKSYPIEENGHSTKYYITENSLNNDFSSKLRVKKLNIQFNAKLLGTEYFKGITNETIKTIYNKIIEQNIVKINFQDFMESTFYDCDITIDYLQNETDHKNDMNYLKEMLQPSLKSGKGYISYQHGLRINNRESINHALFYSKSHELLSDSKHKPEFKNAYFPDLNNESKDELGNIFKELKRVETTIQNAKHFKTLTGRKNTLSELLNFIEEKPLYIHREILNKSFKFKPTTRVMKEISPTERTILTHIKMLKGLNIPEHQIMHETLKAHTDRTEKKRQKKLIQKLLTYLEISNEKPIELKPMNSFLMQLIFDK